MITCKSVVKPRGWGANRHSSLLTFALSTPNHGKSTKKEPPKQSSTFSIVDLEGALSMDVHRVLVFPMHNKFTYFLNMVFLNKCSY